MSLINDAIKRANQVAQRPSGPTDGIRLKPVEISRGPNILPLIVLPLLLAIILGAGGWFLWKGMPWGKKSVATHPTNAVPVAPAVTHTTAAAPSVTVPKPKPVATPAPAAIEPAKLAPTATPPAVATSKPETNISGPVVAIAPPPLISNKPTPKAISSGSGAVPLGPPPVFPDLKLQGIFFRRANPTALVNGESVGVGDEIKGVRVVAIERSSITVELSGRRKIIAFQ